MNIFFSASIRGGLQNQKVYFDLIRHLERYGRVLTKHIANPDLLDFAHQGMADDAIFEKDMAWLAQTDVVVAEVSQPSLGVGYEIAAAERMGKRIFLLYQPEEGRMLSPMLSGNKGLHPIEYHDISEALERIDQFFKDDVLLSREVLALLSE